MKRLMLVPLVLWLSYTARGQQFVRATEGDLVTNGGASRGACLIDYDHDGDLDAFITNSEGEDEFLYRNDGGLVFTRITDDPIAQSGGDSDGATFADVDNDGDLDCFFTNWNNQYNRLFENNGDGTFSQRNNSPVTGRRGYCETGSWADYDNDGDVDLFVTHSAGNAHHNRLFTNAGGWTFLEVTEDPVVADHYDSRSADWCDFDNDGDVDLFTANENHQNDALYRNAGGAFTAESETELVSDGQTSITSSWGDYDNDGDFDLFVGMMDGQQNRLYRNDDGSFTHVTDSPLADAAGWSFGSAWGDYDNDGDLDLFVSNGWQGRRPNYLYENLGGGQFARVTAGPIAADSGWSYGCTWGDVDRDGDLDLLVACWYEQNENNRLYLNSGNGNRWLDVNCDGEAANCAGIGTRIRARAPVHGAAVWQLRQVSGQTGYCGQTLEAHFGFGDAAVIDTLEVLWPSGFTDVHTNIAVNQVITVVEGAGYLNATQRPAPPQRIELIRAYPNPFNGELSLNFVLARKSDYRAAAYDVLGREVAELGRGSAGPGPLSLKWAPHQLAAGSYLVRLNTPHDNGIVRVVYVK